MKLHLGRSCRTGLGRRRGMSLVEVIVAAGMGAIIASLAVTALVVAIKNSDAAHEQLARQVEVSRLGRQFRRDVHAAVDAAPGTEPLLVTLTDGERRIEYQRRADSLERVEYVDDQPRQRETYRIGAEMAVLIDTVPLGSGQLLQMHFAAPAPQGVADVPADRVALSSAVAKSLASVRFEAWLGRDRRGEGHPVLARDPAREPSSPADQAATEESR
ncbi:MAG: type II secretion system protein J [Pirellulales bacterium]